MGKGFSTTLRRIRNIGRFLKDPNQSFFKKILIIFGIIYLVSPLDLVPEPVFGIGIVDDLILWGLLLSWLSDSLDAYPDGESRSRRSRRKYNGQDVFEADARIIEENEEDPEEKDPLEGEKTK